MKKLLWAALALAGLCNSASAWDGLYCGGVGWFPNYSLYARESIPYFAQHPPVYYSYPVARPYGYSPYAYPPTVLTPGTVSVEPLVVRNRYVAAEATVAATAPAGPLVIRNPFVGDAVEQ